MRKKKVDLNIFPFFELSRRIGATINLLSFCSKEECFFRFAYRLQKNSFT